MESPSDYTISRLSEKAVVVQFEPVISPQNLKRVLSLKASLNQNKFTGLIEAVPGYNSLTIYFDPLTVNESDLPGQSLFDKVSGVLTSVDVRTDWEASSVLHTIPVCYDLKYALDLKELAETLTLSIEEIISIHSNQEYLVYLIGFTPGFPYLGVLPSALECKRKENPRKKVPPGSVGIAGKQTGIYPFETPGGWQIIGRTPVDLFSADKEQPSLLKSGDIVKFELISEKEFQSLSS